MYKKVLLVLLFSVVTLNGSVSLKSNLISATGEKDTIEVKAEGYVKEVEKIFEETEDDIEERRSRISQFTSKVTKVLSAPFTKALTKVTLIQMEVICSTIDDFESAGFACFPQLFILSEVLGKKNVDRGQLIQALSNKNNDWKFRWLMAETLSSDLHIKEAKNTMIKVILDESDNKYVRIMCISSIQRVIGDGTYKGKGIKDYIMKVIKVERELRGDDGYTLGTLTLLAKRKNKTEALEVLAQIRTPDAIEILRQIYEDENGVKKEIRERAKVLLKEIESEEQ